MKPSLEQELDAALLALLEPNSFFPKKLFESIRYSVLTPGKRIRPRLTLAVGKMLGLTQEQVMPSALALEWLHCFTLIHDDLPCMDNDDWRRGLPSNHKKFGEATALLAGDSLIPLAVQLVLTSSVDPSRVSRALSSLMKAIGPNGVIGGQALEEQLNGDSTLPQLQRVHELKTAALFGACVELPMHLSGIEWQSQEGRALTEFGRALGMAFQIADDLEDLSTAQGGPSTNEELRKSILRFYSDREAKHLALTGMQNACLPLKKFWSSSSEELLQIVAEVEKKLNPRSGEIAP